MSFSDPSNMLELARLAERALIWSAVGVECLQLLTKLSRASLGGRIDGAIR